MQFEDFDNKLRQAADQHHPNYDENAWANMQKLLDEHMPENRDNKRRFLLLLLLFILIGGGTWVVLSKPWARSTATAAATVTPEKNTSVPAPGVQSQTPATTTPGTSNEPVANRAEPASNGSIPISTTQTSINPTSSNKSQPGLTNKQAQPIAAVTTSVRPSSLQEPAKSTKDQTNDMSVAVTSPLVTNSPASTNNKVNEPSKSDAGKPKADNDVAPTKDKTLSSPVAGTSTTDPKKDESRVVDSKSKPAQKDESRRTNYFFFSASLAPDLSYVSLNNPGTVKLLAGVGAGYTINQRLTLRTGFYTSDKVYSASKEQYKPNVAPVNYPNLNKIDAVCRVYEIPVNLVYQFGKSDKHNIFGSAGLSSFIMKREQYDYLYSYPGNPPTNYTYTKVISNENKHYFSVLTVSAGYEQWINKSLSISAEPYVKLPLSGVGYGKVKLNSAGVMLSVKGAPFGRKKSH